MSEESTTPELAELARRGFEPASRGDIDAMMSFWAPDGVWDLSPIGLGAYEGERAIRAFFEDWIGAYDEFQVEVEEVCDFGSGDFGSGVTLSVVMQIARPVGSKGWVRVRYAALAVWRDRLLQRVTNYTDLDEARAAAERLAGERG